MKSLLFQLGIETRVGQTLQRLRYWQAYATRNIHCIALTPVYYLHMKEADLRQVATERISQFVLKQGERFPEQQSILIDYLKDSIQSFDLPHSHCDSVNAKGRQRTERFNETCITNVHFDARSRNHCRSGKAKGISYSVCVCVCLRPQPYLSSTQAHASYYIVICVLSGSTTFFICII